MNKSYIEIKNELQKKLKTTEFTLTSDGAYHPDDADWNYKDIPHLNITHTQVKAIQAAIGKKSTATINFQKVAFLTIPLLVYNYEYAKGEQIYFTSCGPFILLINTKFRATDLGTVVATTYLIGSKFPFNLLLPVLKKFVKRNYKILMSEDTPMRERRGVLRNFGHRFYRDDDTYSFDFTTKINQNNIRLAADKTTIETTVEALLLGNEPTIGTKCGVLSFQITRNDMGAVVWPSTCPHEGAELVLEESTSSNSIKCPWHGRILGPILRVSNDRHVDVVEKKNYSIDVSGTNIAITYNQ